MMLIQILKANKTVQLLKQENEEMKNKIIELEERLKKYTNGDNHKRYYEKNKDKILEGLIILMSSPFFNFI